MKTFQHFKDTWVALFILHVSSSKWFIFLWKIYHWTVDKKCTGDYKSNAKRDGGLKNHSIGIDICYLPSLSFNKKLLKEKSSRNWKLKKKKFRKKSQVQKKQVQVRNQKKKKTFKFFSIFLQESIQDPAKLFYNFPTG